ncbi:hypothetical protein PIB30_015802 [Stylosanthes scabra]|uniref:Uncharacterized protein n=1 Tax=Stylosanthes scabra TaxID=79078 RepID=A0ABU6Q703_9FABA|nr:hypothetical protein [Stylosanthes scabra]
MMLLEEAELEYGFQFDGPICLPCNVDFFFKVLAQIMDCDDYCAQKQEQQEDEEEEDIIINKNSNNNNNKVKGYYYSFLVLLVSSKRFLCYARNNGEHHHHGPYKVMDSEMVRETNKVGWAFPRTDNLPSSSTFTPLSNQQLHVSQP